MVKIACHQGQHTLESDRFANFKRQCFSESSVFRKNKEVECGIGTI